MTYNIHPLFVHFPIAFLFVYSVIKLLPMKKWIPSVAWRQVEHVLLLVGMLGVCAAFWTGDAAEHIARPDRALVEMHSTFASITAWMYGLLLAGEALFIANPYIAKKWNKPTLIKTLSAIEKSLTNRTLSALLAILGLVAISITGLLGGVMVYGLSADPVAPFVLKLLGITL